MICTYCGHGCLTAAACRRRPRLLWLAALPFALAACGHDTPVPPASLKPPAEILMRDPGEPLPIPECEAEQVCRTDYYGRTRAERAYLAAQVRGLQAWSRTVTER